MLNQNYQKSLKNAKEYPTPIKLGKVPMNLKGTYIQNGPGEFDRWGIKTHPFDGDGYIRKLVFTNGEVYYQGRFINTWQRQLETTFHARLFTGAFGSHPMFLWLKNPVNTNVVFLDNVRIAASSEMGRTHVLDLHTLETIGIHSQDISAHTHEGVSVKRNYLEHSTELIFTENNIHTKIIIPNFIYFHDFCVTDNYYIFFDHGLEMDLINGYLHGWVNGLTFQHQPSTLYIVDKTTHKIHHFLIPEVVGFSYHFICVQQTKYTIELFYTLYPSFFSTPQEEFPGKIYKTTISIYSFSQKTECVHSDWFEFPNYDKHTKECFGILPHKSSLGLYNINTNNIFYNNEPNKIWNEPFFTKDYVMALAYDIAKQQTDLYIYDRKKLFYNPFILALPEDIPMGLHGSWMNA